MSDHSPTIADVARAAGISISTVSRILNNKPDVAEATRQRVLQIIEELGYTPDARAQGLAAGKSRTIGMLYPIENLDLTNLELEFFVGAATAAGEADYFFNLITRPVTQNRLLNLYRSAQIDGVILMQINVQDWRVDLLRERGYPFVMIGHCADNTGLSYIDLDFESAIIKAMEHLIELGHREIALIGHSPAAHEQGFGPAVRSLLGFRRACETYGLRVPYRKVNLSNQGAYRATLELLDAHPGLTALVAVDGGTAMGTLRALQQAGRRIPDDISVLAMTTEKVAQLVTPPLTHIDFPTETMGQWAAEMLIKMLRGEASEPEQVMLEARLVIRESTGPVRHPRRT
ncbi:MAG: LacI family transcriptional regulator [Anaerolineae bacterium]|nr:LacI family transcriptional regulator [Anaerolineae bacterium]